VAEPAAPPERLPRISLVIPAFDEERLLPRLLDSVERARARHPQGPTAVETVVADNGSTDGTAELAARRGCRVVAVEKRAIAAARNGGAAAARGEILAFTDADGRVHPDTFAAIETALARPGVLGGATGATLERWSLGLALTYALFLPFVWLTGFDTGVVFCRRRDFEAVGGYDERRPYGEDVVFLAALARHGRRDRRRLVRLRHVRAIASTRKFDEYGDWHYFTRMPGLAWRMLFRESAADEFVERYWYRRGR
jgi:glycosyltransferase involved in cell wall biosynthesis